LLMLMFLPFRPEITKFWNLTPILFDPKLQYAAKNNKEL
jgi:hypothetical protein